MTEKEMIDAIKEAGLKKTPARMGVLVALASQHQPSDIAELAASLESQKISADQATVYRVVEKFVEVGLVKAVNFGEGKSRYELAHDHHHHLVCENCKKVQPIAECEVEDLGKKIHQTHGFKVTRHDLEFFGLCRKCRD